MLRARRWAPALGGAVLVACSGGGPSPPSLSPAPSLSATATPTPSALPTGSATPTPVASDTPSPTRSPSPRPSVSASRAPVATATVLRRLVTSRRVVALTFDAGSDTGHAARILDLLADRGVHATFGLTGAWVRANPELARRVVREGHLVVNHTDRHLSFTGSSTGKPPLTRTQRWQALADAEATIRSTTGASTKPWFRPPYGDRDAGVDRDVAAAGYRYELMWTVDTLGWKGVAKEEVVDRVVSRLEPGMVVLMHVGQASTDADALVTLLDRLERADYSLVRADGAV